MCCGSARVKVELISPADLVLFDPNWLRHSLVYSLVTNFQIFVPFGTRCRPHQDHQLMAALLVLLLLLAVPLTAFSD